MATELKAKDFLLHYLKKEYTKRSKILSNMVFHVERLHKDFIFTNIERTRHLKSINELVKMLNNYYESRTNTIKGIKFNAKHDDRNFEFDEEKQKLNEQIKIDKIVNIDKNLSEILKQNKNKINLTINQSNTKETILDTLYEYSFDLFKNELSKFCPNDFDQFDKKIKEIVCSKEKEDYKIYGMGCKSLNDIILLFSCTFKNELNLNSDETMLFDVLNMSFVPLTIEQKTKEGKSNIKMSKEIIGNEKYDQLLGNFYKIELNTPCCDNIKQLHIYGFFENDCVDSILRSSHTSNEFIYKKKNHFVDLITGKLKLTKLLQKISAIPDNFKDIFIQNMTIAELIGWDDSTFANEMSCDYIYYQKYSSGGNFRNVFSDFINSSLLSKFKIIKYLLLSDNSNNAGLLFSLTKESKSGSPIIADIIYKNLNLSLQLKLHKENISIKNEMEKMNTIDTDDIDMKKQIMLNKNIPQKVKKLALEKLNEMKTGGSEYYKQLMYVKAVIDYPWIGENDSDIFTQYKHDRNKWKEIILSTKKQLDEKVYGHTECKDTVSELLAKWFTNPNSLGKSLALQGPPGVGKTMIAMELGKSLGLPFAKINLAGVDDNSILIGHSSTYSGSNYGLIVKKMTETQAPRCIIFFDELDKTATHHGRNEIFDVLIHVTDSTTNSQFNDKFFQDISFPLNKVLFVFSFNNKEKIDPILLDRMEIIKVDPYSTEDKLNIVNKYLIKEIKNDIGIQDLNVKISDPNIVYLIETFTSEPGVRSIKRKLEKIFLKLNKERIFCTGPFEKNKNAKNIEITKELIDQYLGKPPVFEQKIHLVSEVGYVNGLYATDGGEGGLVPVIMYKNQLGKGGKFTFKITGNLKKVMTDSISLAFTMASNFVKPKYIKSFFDSYPHGLHIHSGDLSTGKEGPSATTTYTVAFISKILNMKIKHNIAMTGECGGNGEVTAIGGLVYKLRGALKAGVKLVFAPKENEKDLEKIKSSDKNLINDNFRVILVSNIKEILEYALIESEEFDPTEKNQSKDFTYEKTFNHTKYLQNSCIQTSPVLCNFDTDCTNDINSSDDDNDDNEDNESICNSSDDSDCSSHSNRNK